MPPPFFLRCISTVLVHEDDMKYNERGEEILDDTPVEAPIKFTRPRSIQELIALHVRSMMQVDRAMGKDDEEDFEEYEERDDILTPYELHAMAGEADLEFRRAKHTKEVLDKLRKKKENGDTVNGDRKTEVSDGNGKREGKRDSERSGDASGKSGAVADGEVGAKAGG